MYDHHLKIMSYNIVKKMTKSATPDHNVTNNNYSILAVFFLLLANFLPLVKRNFESLGDSGQATPPNTLPIHSLRLYGKQLMQLGQFAWQV